MKKLSLFLVTILLLNLLPMHGFASNTDNIIADIDLTTPSSAIEQIFTDANQDTKNGGYILNADVPSDNKYRLGVRLGGENVSYKNYKVEISYVDSGYGWFTLQYKAGSGSKTKYCESVFLNDTGKTQTHVFEIYGALFNQSMDGNWSELVDFIVTSYKSSDNYCFSTVPVTIQHIKVSTDDTYSMLTHEITSENDGNIFFTGEPITISVAYKNNDETAAKFIVDYRIYKLDSDCIREENPTISDSFVRNLAAKKVYFDTLKFEVAEYGLYELEIEFTGETNSEKKIHTVINLEFSKCMLNERKNASLGVNAHFVTLRGDPNIGTALMSKAGIGNLREGFSWEGYEQEYGKRTLPKKVQNTYNAAYENGINVLSIIDTGNSMLDPLIEADQSRSTLASKDIISSNKLYEYVRSYMNESITQKAVKMIEIENEPEFIKYLDGVDISSDADKYKKIGERWGEIANQVCKAVREVNPDMPVGGLATTVVDNKGNISTLINSGLQKMKTLGTKLDATTLHTYHLPKNYEAPEGVFTDTNEISTPIVDRITAFDKIYNNNGLTISKRWFTEMGYSSAPRNSTNNTTVVGSEYEAAKLLIRQYACIKEFDPDSIMFIYNLINDGADKNALESNFGLLRCWKDEDVPYAAKYGYLAVAALNRLTAGSTGVQSVIKPTENENYIGAYVSKFTGIPGRKVYMLWTPRTNESDGVPLSCFDDENLTYYDMLGNMISADDVVEGNVIKVTDAPIYAVSGEPIVGTKDDLTISVEGNIVSACAGKRVAFTVLPVNAMFGVGMENYMKFFDQSVTQANGAYSFEASVFGEDAVDAYVISEDGDRYKYTIEQEKIPITMSLRNGIVNLSSLRINSIDASKLTAEIDFGVGNINIDDIYTVICARYLDDNLVDITTASDTYDGNAINSYDVSSSDSSIKFDTVRLFLWDSLDTIFPLCSLQVYKNDMME